MDIINSALVVVLIIDFILIVISFIGSKKKDEKTIVYLINVVTIAWWVGSMVLYRISDGHNILALTKNLYISATLIASSFYYFSLIFPNTTKTHWVRAINISVVNTGIILLTAFTDTIIYSASVNTNGGENIINFGRLYILYVIYILYFFLTSFIRLFIKYFKSTEKTERSQILFLVLGYTISGNIAFVTNLLLPWGNYFKLNWLGQIATLFMAASITYAVTKHKLFNTKVITAELFIFALWIFTAIRTFVSGNITEQITNIAFLILVILVGLLLIRSVKREVDQRERIQLLASDLEKANKDMEKANERLKELDQMKSEFVSLATHQIRSPLTAIKGYVSLVEEGDYGPVSDRVKEALNVVHVSTDNLVTIVNDFLNVSRIEQGSMKYDFKTFNIEQLAQQVVTELKPNVEKKGLKINYCFDKDKEYTVYGDLGKIKQIIGNIIDNAIKYTPKGHIAVAVTRPNNEKVQIKVSDTGVGMPARVIPKLFQKYSRASTASDVNILGTGLGLYIAKEMVEAHKGRIWAESEGDGKGSQFYIELPTTKEIPANAA